MSDDKACGAAPAERPWTPREGWDRPTLLHRIFFHRPVQYRNNRPATCRGCGLTGDGQVPLPWPRPGSTGPRG